jgi:hypothetical protein
MEVLGKDFNPLEQMGSTLRTIGLMPRPGLATLEYHLACGCLSLISNLSRLKCRMHLVVLSLAIRWDLHSDDWWAAGDQMQMKKMRRHFGNRSAGASARWIRWLLRPSVAMAR